MGAAKQFFTTYLKPAIRRFKPYLRWLIFGATLFFIGSTLRSHWHEVQTLRLRTAGWQWLAASLGITLLAHCWTGWVWSWILRSLGLSASGLWSMQIYLKTNIAKYLPGNVWHLYGRVVAAKQAGFPTSAATLSVLLEPLLMAAAALLLALMSAQKNWGLQVLALIAVLAAIHPKVLNPLLQLASRFKGQTTAAQPSHELRIQSYPWQPLLGELGFVLLRGIGFLAALQALQPIAPSQIPATLSGFSIAWVLGLVIPGAPGGIGVFEATAIGLLTNQYPIGIILGGVALYRLVSLLAEVGGAGLAYLATMKPKG